MRCSRGSLRAALLLLAGLACAGAPGPVDVRLPVAGDPEGGPALRLGRVEEARVFERSPGNGRVQSLAAGASDAPSLAARVIGRRRSASGQLMGNVLLPEGRSVAQLVAEAVTNGFREAGYRVLGSGAPDSQPAIDVVVRRFWTRVEIMGPGLAWEFSSEVWIRAPVPVFEGGAWVCGKAFAARGGPTPGIWAYTVRRGLEDLVERLRTRLVSGSAPPYC